MTVEEIIAQIPDDYYVSLRRLHGDTPNPWYARVARGSCEGQASGLDPAVTLNLAWERFKLRDDGNDDYNPSIV